MGEPPLPPDPLPEPDPPLELLGEPEPLEPLPLPEPLLDPDPLLEPPELGLDPELVLGLPDPELDPGPVPVLPPEAAVEGDDELGVLGLVVVGTVVDEAGLAVADDFFDDVATLVWAAEPASCLGTVVGAA